MPPAALLAPAVVAVWTTDGAADSPELVWLVTCLPTATFDDDPVDVGSGEVKVTQLATHPPAPPNETGAEVKKDALQLVWYVT